MKPLKVLFIFILIGNSIIIFSKSDPVTIDLRNNGVKLDAKFYPASEVGSSPTVILLHGFPGNPNSPYGLAEKIVKNGINVLVFNYEGSFKSEGIFSWEHCMADAGAAVAFLKQRATIDQFRIDTSKIYFCGCSLGAAIVLSSAIYHTDIDKIIAVVGGNDLSIYLQKMKNDPVFRSDFEKRVGSAAIPNGLIKGDSAYIHNYFNQIIPNFEYFDLIKNADKFNNKKILFITAWLDTLVPMEEFILPAYRHLKNMYPESVSIKAFETGHTFTNEREELATTICEWIINN